ncbi:MAG: DUF4349 domain-containing protein [Oscillospiraceae bacterium]|jgi:hypothetical protein|nr:DUF4349 domain-containing protein [Oscillospiraceae bacterium]
MKNRLNKLFFIPVLCAAIILTCAACAAGYGGAPQAMADNPTTAGGADSFSYAKTAAAEEAVPAEVQAAEGSMYRNYDETNPTAGESAEANMPAGAKIIRTMTLSIETKTFDQSMANLEQIIARNGGYKEYSYVNGFSGGAYNQERSANFSIRVPSKNLDAMAGELSSIGSVLYRQENAQDVTLQYSDIETHLKVLREEQTKLMEMLGKAETMDQMVVIEQRLSEIRYEVESYESQRRYYDNQVDYSTITLDMREVIDYSDPVRQETFLERIGNGFLKSIRDIGVFFTNLVANVIIGIPYLIILAIIAAVIIVLVKRSSKKRAARIQQYQETHASVPPQTDDTKNR